MKNKQMKDEVMKRNPITTVKPFIYKVPSISVVCMKLFFLLLIQVVMLGVTKSFDSLYVVITSLAGAICVCALSYLIYREALYNFWPIIVQGLLIGLFLPEKYPLVAVFFISFLIILISRFMVFRSINSWVNIVATAVIVAWFIGSNYFPEFLISQDMLTLKNPSIYLLQNGSFKIYNFDTTITQFLNSTIFHWLKINIPEGFVSMLWDTHSVIPAFRFNLITIISSVILFSDNSLNPTIPTIFMFTYLLFVRLFAPVFFGGTFNQGDILLALFSSGTLFTSLYLIQWFGTTPITVAGKIIFAIISGICAFFITGCGTSPNGMVYTVLVSNIINMVIRFFEERNNKLKLTLVLSRTLSRFSEADMNNQNKSGVIDNSTAGVSE